MNHSKVAHLRCHLTPHHPLTDLHDTLHTSPSTYLSLNTTLSLSSHLHDDGHARMRMLTRCAWEAGGAKESSNMPALGLVP